MSVENILKNKVVKKPLETYKKELKEVSESNLVSRLLLKNRLKKDVAEFGLALADLKGNYSGFFVYLGSEKAAAIAKWIKPNMWDDSNYYDLLVYFFGTEQAPYIKQAWQKLPHKMYQHGDVRRSFRAPHNDKYLLVNQINFLRGLMEGPCRFAYPDNTYYSLSLEEQICYDTDLTNAGGQFMVWSAAIDAGNTAVYHLVEDIIFGRHPQGKVSRNIIKAFLNSTKKECWQLVEKLLLAAQRQEGLRQTILEALDETDTGALQYMINVIIEHKLTRFSSVVRAIDVWTGLGWDAEKEATVKNILGLAAGYFNDIQLIAAGVRSKNNNEVYMALWVQAVFDVEKTVPWLHELLEKGPVEKKCLAIKFAGETQDPYIEMPLYYKALQYGDPQVLAFALPRMNALLEANLKSKFYIDNKDYPDFFDIVYGLSQSIGIKEKIFEGKVFSWLNAKFEKDALYAAAIKLIGEHNSRLERILTHFEGLSIELRTLLTQNLLKDFYTYGYMRANNTGDNKTPTDFQRSFALRILKDRGETMVATALNTLRKVTMDDDEEAQFFELLKRKNTTLKKSLAAIILEQREGRIESLINNILENGDAEQRMSALDMMLQLQKKQRMTKMVNSWVKDYAARPKITEKELKFIEQLLPEQKKEVLNEENGYGFYNPGQISKYALPVPHKDGLYTVAVNTNQYGFSTSLTRLKTEILRLKSLFEQNGRHEYQVENYDNSKETVLLGNVFRQLKKLPDTAGADENAANYPLYHVWEEWFKTSGLVERDLFLLTLAGKCEREEWKSFLGKHVFYHEGFIPNPLKGAYSYYWNNPLVAILQSLQYRFPFKEKENFLIDACSTLYADMPGSMRNYEYKPGKNEYYYRDDNDNGWQSQGACDVYLKAINLEGLTLEQSAKVWHLYRWRQFSGLKKSIPFSKPPIYIYCVAFRQNLITKSELYEGILERTRLSVLTGKTKHYSHYGGEKLTENFPVLVPMVNEVRDMFLDIELKRGDSDTSVTHLVIGFERIYGINRFTELITGLGRQNLYKGYIYSWGSESLNRQKLFSYLLKRCYPSDTDTQEAFNQLMEKTKTTEERLIQAAIYAPQWQKFISSHLGWNGLDEGIWWLHAHTKTSTYSDVNAELESEAAKFSAIDLQDFKDGAVDRNWFVSAYKKLGKARWEMLYDSAKYVTDGNGHRRARLYADTIIGDLKIKEVTAKVKDKRDQDYLRVYGLVPLSKVNPEKDVLSRYEYLQQFKKESREFGAMKQTSELLAIRVALENLARNAGYPDPVRLTWAMETRQVQNILSKETEITVEGTAIRLIVNPEGKAEVVAIKGDKELKTIPANVKKDKGYTELVNYRKTMREQWTRSRKGLEESMVRGDEFLFSEITNLFEHPVISKHLEKLVLITNDNRLGFYINGNLVTAQGEVIELNENQTFRIAHCYDLHQNKVWTDYQRYCFDNQLQQPFKQVFRELYMPTPDEMAEKSVSRRYAGHQVNPKQTLALLKSRGWKVDYEEGLQKVFHKEGYHVKLYAMANWFSPADVESPTLETIEFHSLKEYKNIAFDVVNPRIFSEVMRDIDLVVSVAHVGGVDPEASHSSIEMRAVLLRETLRLFKVGNVEIKQNHALITGKMANYSVHLGSGVVHQVPGRYLSILPVHSQHRGRLFLPFADDDPKSAEVMSKVLLLAKDDKIQDPTILTQIDKNVGV
jgi:Family of unknown function (DUF5724)/Domain of unknown function (DUF4132)